MPTDYSKLREVCPLLDDFIAKGRAFTRALQGPWWNYEQVERTGDEAYAARMKYFDAATAAQPEIQQRALDHEAEAERARRAQDLPKAEAEKDKAIDSWREIDGNARAFCNAPTN